MSLPQLTFGLNNPNADNTIYVSSTASDNDLTLVIGTTVAASFEPATTVVDESQAGTVTGSLLYLKLGPAEPDRRPSSRPSSRTPPTGRSCPSPASRCSA